MSEYRLQRCSGLAGRRDIPRRRRALPSQSYRVIVSSGPLGDAIAATGFAINKAMAMMLYRASFTTPQTQGEEDGDAGQEFVAHCIVALCHGHERPLSEQSQLRIRASKRTSLCV
jgi:hypothetical protein